MPNAKEAIIDCLRGGGATPEEPVGMFSIGVPLIGEGFSENDIVNGLFWLKSEGIIELLGDNRLHQAKAFDVRN